MKISKVPLCDDAVAVDGSFRLREDVLTLVNLAKFPNVRAKEVANEDRLVILMELNDLRVGVSVDEVERIYRRSWSDIEPPLLIILNAGTPITGVTRIDDEIIPIIDFESLMFELLGEKSPDDLVEDTDEKTKGVADTSNARTLLAEDSPIIRQGVEKLLRSRGFENLVVCSDGVKVWAAIEASRNNGGPLFDLILTDIEMPGLDGLHLTTRIRKEERLRNTKVVLFSSIVNPKNDNKGNSVGADAQVAKNSDRLILETIKVC